MKSKVIIVLFACLIAVLSYELKKQYRRTGEQRTRADDLSKRLEQVEAALAASRSEVSRLSAIETSRAAAITTTTPPESSAVSKRPKPVKPDDRPAESGMAEANRRLVADSRINAMQKMFSLTDAQRERLRSKFELELSGQKAGETLEEIIGEGNAKFYRDLRRKSFERAKSESIEKEILYFARKLQLTEQQESMLRNAYSATDEEVNRKMQELFTNVPRELAGRQLILNKILTESQLRDNLLSEKLKEILAPGQYAEYVKLQAESSAQDMQLWHGP
ncbi:MAG: hypothetical protein J5J00_04570 [Deltaproteobacteria bacterium]|nr:hypothetical protein [Deltaproteobacteria bacterium]